MSDDISNDNHLEEWKEARGIIGRFDGYIHEIRKYGFTFLGGLITVDILQKFLQVDTLIKFGLLTLTMLFIVALRLFEDIYSKYLRAASIRAKILETTFLDLEVTEFISYKYKREKVSSLTIILYLAFIILVLGIGFIILPQNLYLYGFIVIAIGGGLAVFFIDTAMPLTMGHPPIKGLSHPDYDWSVDRVYCTVGDKVKITIVNLKEEPLTFNADYPFKISKEGDNNGSEWNPGKIDTIIAADGNYSWLWDTSNSTPGTIYRIFPYGWDRPLHRSIVLSEKPPVSSQTIIAAYKNVKEVEPITVVKEQP